MSDTAGAIQRSVTYSNKIIGGAVTLRVAGNYLTVVAINDAYPNYYGAVFKIDLRTLKTVWEVDIPNIDRCFGDVDTSGAVYFAGTKMVKDTTAPGFHEFWYAKISPDGHVLTEKGWYGRETYETNYENWVNGVAFSNDIVVMGGSIQDGDTHTGNKRVYLATLNSADGRKTWGTSFMYGSYINQVQGCVFAPDGNLVVLGNAALPYMNWIESYKLLVTDVPRETNQTPKDFSLSQNYPNSFNPSTMINFQLPISNYITLKVYDVLGREVATLVNEEKSAGRYSVVFNASDLPSGVYFYRITAEGNSKQFTDIKKLMLLK